MKKRNTLILLLIAIIMSCGFVYYWFFIKSQIQQPTQPQEKPQKPTKIIQRIHLHPDTFANLPGWFTADDHKQSFKAFQISCETILRQQPEANAGSKMLHLQIKDWQPACQAALEIPQKSLTDKKARQFFEQWFTPWMFYHEIPSAHQKDALTGLFTGYYMPFLKGSLVKTSTYNIPIYGMPDNLITVDLSKFNPQWAHKRIVGRVEDQQLIPYYTRAEIDAGVLKDHAPVIAWTNSVFDRLNLEIEGSGVMELPNGEKLYLGYASGNGAPYIAIGRVLIDQGVLTRDNASMQRIRNYLETHPKKMQPVIHQNKSFVFFKVLDKQIALGAQGVGLTSGYSLAVDRQWIPMGTPLWLNTTHPDKKYQDKSVLQRLMIAQDTGGAIRGVVRGDVYWGAGKRAEHIAGNMRNQGQYWLLVPKHIAIARPVKVAPK